MQTSKIYSNDTVLPYFVLFNCSLKLTHFLLLFTLLVVLKGRSINMKSAGIVGRNGPQSKQPFLVSFFKASEVLLRSVRAAGGKRKNHNRNKSGGQQESPRAPKSGGGLIKLHSQKKRYRIELIGIQTLVTVVVPCKVCPL